VNRDERSAFAELLARYAPTVLEAGGPDPDDDDVVQMITEAMRLLARAPDDDHARRDHRTALFIVVKEFCPALVGNLDHTDLSDDQIQLLVGEGMALLDAEVLEARKELALLEAQGAASEPPGYVSPEQLAELLRHHRTMYNDVHAEPYTDPAGMQRSHPRTVPRPARAEDVLSYRDTETGVSVVLRDGRSYLLAYSDQPTRET
jgi:hypothetical protein